MASNAARVRSAEISPIVPSDRFKIYCANARSTSFDGRAIAKATSKLASSELRMVDLNEVQRLTGAVEDPGMWRIPIARGFAVRATCQAFAIRDCRDAQTHGVGIRGGQLCLMAAPSCFKRCRTRRALLARKKMLGDRIRHDLLDRWLKPALPATATGFIRKQR